MLDKGLTAQNVQLTKSFHSLPDSSLHDRSAEFKPWQAAAPINAGLCSWRVEQVAQQAPNMKCRLSGGWPGVQACFISNYRKGGGILFGFEFLFPEYEKGYELKKQKQLTKAIRSPTSGYENSALKHLFLLN